MNQPPPYDGRNVTAPTHTPSYPGIQNQPQHYSATSHGYAASQYPTSSAAPGQRGSPRYIPPQSPILNNPFNQPGLIMPNELLGPTMPPQNAAFVAGQVQLPSQEHQFMGAGFNQEQQQFPQSGPAETPTAPSIDQMSKVPGYENVNFDGGFLPPPPPDPNARGQQPIRVDFSNFQTMTTEEARDALLTYVGEHSCYGKRAARNMILNNIQNIPAIHYTLETFAEKRESLWAYDPYVGQRVDSPENGLAPEPWEVSIPVGEPYVENVKLVEVPHTASVKQCHDCGAFGRKKCYKCVGLGRVICQYCNGRGCGIGAHHHRCTWCWGHGQIQCDLCQGTGQIVCPSCDGRLQLKWFIQLKSIRKVHLIDYVIERTPMPDELVKTVSGQIIFEEDAPRMWPITNFPDEELNNASAACIQQHNSIQETERIVSQRHKIRIVPVAQVSSSWKGKKDDFYVYGFENKIYSPNYPQQRCWGCNIL